MAAAVVELAVCVAFSRALVTALSAALRSRRGRDLRFLLLALAGLLPETLHLLLFAGHNQLTSGRTAPTVGARASAGFPRCCPSGPWPPSPGATGRPRWLSSPAGRSPWCSSSLWWSRSLEVVMTTAEASAAPASAPSARREGAAGRGGRVALPLFSPGLDSLPAAGPERWRPGSCATPGGSPAGRVQLARAGSWCRSCCWPGCSSDGGLHRHRIVFAALLVAFLAGNNRAINQFGMDGPAFWIHESAGAGPVRRSDRQEPAVALTTLPLAALTAVVLAAISGGWAELAMTIGLSVG